MGNTTMMHGRWRAGIVCALGLAALAGCDRGKGAAAAPPAFPPPPVMATEVITREVPNYLDEIGKTTARERVAIQPQVSGAITGIKFADGAEVKQGDILFTIDPRPYQAALAQAEASLAQSTASLNHAKLDWQRVKDLQQGVVTQEDRDNKQNAVEVSEAQVQASKAAIETARINLDYCTIKSPIDGLAGQRQVDLGAVVIANNPMATQSSLVTVQRLDPIYADFTVNEDQLLRVRQEMARGTLRTRVKLPEDTDYRDGDLTFLDNSVQDGSGTIKLRATIPNKDRHFWPGQFVQVRLVLKVVKDAVLVPSSVPQMSQKGPYVLVVKDGSTPDGKPATVAEMRPVKLGQPQGDLVVIESGVAAGELVITDGQMMVRPGGAVKVLPPATQPAPADKGAAAAQARE